jgi:hypothetical protein
MKRQGYQGKSLWTKSIDGRRVGLRILLGNQSKRQAMRAIKVFILLLLSCVPVFAGEKLITLKTGETSPISYGLSCLVSDSSVASNFPPDGDLVLTFRNIGAKWISFDGMTTNNFSLRDAKGQDMKIYLVTPPQGLAWSEATFAHIRVYRAGDAPQPWTLNFKSPDTFVPFELTITNITLPKN